MSDVVRCDTGPDSRAEAPLSNPGADLTGRKILLVEDEYFIAQDMTRVLQEKGAEIAGPVPSVEDALNLIERTDRLDGAVLDINLRGHMAFPVADALIGRGVPFVFSTGYDDRQIPSRYGHVPRCEKPVDPLKIAQALFA